MARKQNKSSKVLKKDASVPINSRKGGKITKKQSSSKTKKVESQLKQAVKSEKKQNKNQIGLNSFVKTDRKNSRSNTEKAKKSSTPMSQRSIHKKGTTSTRASASPRTGEISSTSKGKSNPVKKKVIKKDTVTSKSLKYKKDEKPQKQTENKMNLRGKKRSYAELASGNVTIETNVSKKMKTIESKNITSRRSRSIKPTAKGTEWRNIILQKKSNAQQEKVNRKTETKLNIRKTEKSSSTNISSATANKSSKSSKGTKSQANTTKKSSVRLSKSSVSTVKIQSPSKCDPVKKSRKSNSSSSKAPRAGNKSQKTALKTPVNKTKSSNPNTLATSIKKKFDSCIYNKRQSKDSKLEENVLVAQGILHDILHSIGTPDILSSDEKFEGDGDVKTVDSSTTNCLGLKNISSINDLTGIVVCGDDKEPRESRAEVESTMDNLISGQAADVTHGNHNSELILKSTSHSNPKIVGFEMNTVEQSHNKKTQEVEEMELHLSYTSATSINDESLDYSENNSKENSEICAKTIIDNSVDSCFNSNLKVINEQTSKEDKLEGLSKDKLVSCTDSNVTTFLSNGIKNSLQVVSEKESSLQEDIGEKDLSLKESNSFTLEFPVTNSEFALDSSGSFEESGIEPKNLIEASKDEIKNNFNSSVSLKSLNDEQGDSATKIDTDITKTVDVITNNIVSESTSKVGEILNSLSNGKTEISDSEGIKVSSKNDHSSIDKSQNGQLFKTNEEKITNGVIQKSNEVVSNCSTEEIKTLNNKGALEIIQDRKEMLPNDFVDIKKSVDKDTSSQNDNVILKEILESENSKSEYLNEGKDVSEDEPKSIIVSSDSTQGENVEISGVNSKSQIAPGSKLLMGKISTHNGNTQELNLESCSSKGLTENINLISFDSKSSSSTIEGSQENKKTDLTTNHTDINKVCTNVAECYSKTEPVSVDRSHSPKEREIDVKLPYEPPQKIFKGPCPSENIGAKSTSAEEPSFVSFPNEKTIEEPLKMEEGSQEATQEPIIVDETDGESMQYNSDSHSNRMSIDEETPGMEVDSEEVTKVVGACPAIEINMEVSKVVAELKVCNILNFHSQQISHQELLNYLIKVVMSRYCEIKLVDVLKEKNPNMFRNKSKTKLVGNSTQGNVSAHTRFHKNCPPSMRKDVSRDKYDTTRLTKTSIKPNSSSRVIDGIASESSRKEESKTERVIRKRKTLGETNEESSIGKKICLGHTLSSNDKNNVLNHGKKRKKKSRESCWENKLTGARRVSKRLSIGKKKSLKDLGPSVAPILAQNKQSVNFSGREKKKSKSQYQENSPIISKSPYNKTQREVPLMYGKLSHTKRLYPKIKAGRRPPKFTVTIKPTSSSEHSPMSEDIGSPIIEDIGDIQSEIVIEPRITPDTVEKEVVECNNQDQSKENKVGSNTDVTYQKSEVKTLDCNIVEMECLDSSSVIMIVNETHTNIKFEPSNDNVQNGLNIFDIDGDKVEVLEKQSDLVESSNALAKNEAEESVVDSNQTKIKETIINHLDASSSKIINESKNMMGEIKSCESKFTSKDSVLNSPDHCESTSKDTSFNPDENCESSSTSKDSSFNPDENCERTSTSKDFNSPVIETVDITSNESD